MGTPRNKRNYEKCTLISSKRKSLIFLIALLMIIGLGSIYELIDEKKEKSENIEDSKAVAQEVEPKNNLKKEEIDRAENEVKLISEKVNKIIEGKSESYGIYYYDLGTGVKYSINEDVEFQAASTIKIPIAMMIADKIKNNEIDENYTIEYEDYDYEEGAGILQGQVKTSQKISIKELVECMIIDSDNIATNMLKKVAGDKNEYISNITGIEINGDENVITPRQEFLMLSKLYNETKEVPYYSNIIELMKKTNFHDRLDKYLPHDIVAHKIGDYGDYINDVGIIYSDRPYILCILTNGQGEEGRENIARISKVIYDIKSDKLS